VTLRRAVCAAWLATSVLAAQEPVRARAVEVDSGRFTFIAFPRDAELARSLLGEALTHDTFPGLPRPRAHVRVLITPDALHFRDAVGPSAPEWGAAIASPENGRIVMQGSRANSSAGDPRATLRHELAHLALHEVLGGLPPRWFDEGYASYAAGETGRDDILATNVALVFRGIPPLDSLDPYFAGGESGAQTGYALARTAVAGIAALDPARGLSLFFGYWRQSGSMDQALRRAYGVTEAGFEAQWTAEMRRRYGALALFADVTFAAGLLVVLVLPFWLVRRRRDRARMAAMRLAEEGTESGNENLIN
jgi:hypothetical protein